MEFSTVPKPVASCKWGPLWAAMLETAVNGHAIQVSGTEAEKRGVRNAMNGRAGRNGFKVKTSGVLGDNAPLTMWLEKRA